MIMMTMMIIMMMMIIIIIIIRRPWPKRHTVLYSLVGKGAECSHLTGYE
jgi:hypothetical protein